MYTAESIYLIASLSQKYGIRINASNGSEICSSIYLRILVSSLQLLVFPCFLEDNSNATFFILAEIVVTSEYS